jgi:branched-chain amino acid transport system permease protein
VTRLLGPRVVLPAVLALLVVAPLWINAYLRFVLNLVLVYAILSLGLNLLLGYAGQFAFANAAFFGWGAYATALLQVRLGAPYLLALLLGALTAALVGALIGRPALRLRGLYLAIVTLAFGEVTSWAMNHWPSLTGGPSGFKAPAPALPALGLGPERTTYYLSLLVATALFVAAWGIAHSRVGRAFVAVREGEIVAQALAVNLTATKTLAFVLSAFYAGVAGGLHSAALRYVAPESFDLFQMVLQFCMVVVGGLGSVIGSLLGAVLVVGLREALRAAVGLQEILFGGLLMVSIVFLPRGLVSLLRWPGSPWIEHLHWTSARVTTDRMESWQPSP